MIKLSIIEQFQKLPVPASPRREGEVFSALALADWPEHRVAKDTRGNACILLAGRSDTANPAVQLKHLEVSHQMRCNIIPLNEEKTSPANSSFSIIRCTTGDIHLQQHFLLLAETVVRIIGKNPTPAQITSGILTLASLFESSNKQPQRGVQGVWAELFIIERSKNPEILVGAWHPDPTNLFDFTMNRERLEVKSTTSRRREHSFALDQLHPPNGVKLVVASLRTQRVAFGVSTAHLLERISRRLRAPALQLKLQSVFHEVVGKELETTLETQFDYEQARDSLIFLDSTYIPKLPNEMPPGVSNVRFNSDLTECPVLSDQEAQRLGSLYAASVAYKEAKDGCNVHCRLSPDAPSERQIFRKRNSN